jgi:hypothetical protein
MYINSIGNNSQYQSRINKLTTSPITKEQISFKGNDNDSFESGDLFFRFFKEIAETAYKISLKSVMTHAKNEREFSTYIEALSQKSSKQYIKQNRTTKLEVFNNAILTRVNTDPTFTNELFKEAGMTTVMQFNSFLNIFNQTPETKENFRGQNIEAIKIYGKLNNKEDLSKYSELLLYLYNEEEYKENPDYNKLNEYVDFLKQLGVTNFKDFDEKFSHLSSDFHDFENIADKVDAINYVKENYQDRINYLQNIIKDNPNFKNTDPKTLYAKINDVIDRLSVGNYDINKDKIPEIINYATLKDKFKTQALNIYSNQFNNYQQTEDKIDFYSTLANYNISPSDFNEFATKSIISDSDIMSHLRNIKDLSQYVSTYKGINIKDSQNFYKKNKDLLNAVYDEKTGDVHNVNFLLDLMEKYNISTSDSFMSFYNKVNYSKAKNITTEELKNFLEAFKYTISDNILKTAKEQNISPKELLDNEKTNFENVKNEIENFIKNDETSYFTGKTPFEIYKEYADVIGKNPNEVTTILQNIVNFNISTSTQYLDKFKEVEKFEKFFNDKEEMSNFINLNEIKFDNSQENFEYRNYCYDILNTLYEDNQNSKELDYYKNSDFLSNSKIKLDDFMKTQINDETRKRVLSIIADKKIPSLTAMEKFFQTYSSDKNSDKELLEYLEKLPENIDFEEDNKILSALKLKFRLLNISLPLNPENLKAINMEKLSKLPQITTRATIQTINDIFKIPENINFVTTMPLAVDNSEKNYPAFRIAQDIVARKSTNNESYQNIKRLLNLEKSDLGIPDDCSDYIYINAIEQVLPKEFIDFVNSNDWLQYSEEKDKTPNVVLHARLRAIDRFALDNANNINELYTDETKQKLKDLFKSIYTTAPTSVKGGSPDNRIIVSSQHKINIIETIFSNQGQLITLFQKGYFGQN